MQIREHDKLYLPPEQSLLSKEKLSNGIQINAGVVFYSKKFLDYQKEIIQDFLANIIDICSDKYYDLDTIKINFEAELNGLNVKLESFADRVEGVDYFPIKGFVQIIAMGTLISSMIGDTSMVIFRENKLYYEVFNSEYSSKKTDLFSDFIEGEIEKDDEVVYLGENFKELLDKSDITNVQDALANDENTLITMLDSVLTKIIDSQKIAFIVSYYVHGLISHPSDLDNKKIQKDRKNKILKIFKKGFLHHKYYITVAFLVLLILFLLYAVLSSMLKNSSNPVFLTDAGTYVDLTVDDIKQDVFDFQSLESNSNEKAEKYNEIISKINFLESKGLRIEDVKYYKSILEENYYEGFDIFRVSDMDRFNDPATGIKAKVFAFNDIEKEKLGDLKSIHYSNTLMLGGTRGAIIGAVNDGSRGAVVEYLIEEDMKSCSINILRNGLYCYTSDGRIFLVTNQGVEQANVVDDEFPDTIGGLGVYGKSNLYVFQPNLNSSLSNVFVTRYRNNIGSQSSFQKGQNYTPVPGSPYSFSSDFAGSLIDGGFLTWVDGALYELWRPSTAFANLEIRKVALIGGSQLGGGYSNDISVLGSYNSRYLSILDKTKQTLTVYESNPPKNSEGENTHVYKLQYLLSFSFNIEGENIVDAIIDEGSGNKPEVYLLSNDGVYKINLYEYINSVSAGEDVSI